jgi:glutamine amidotransferase
LLAGINSGDHAYFVHSYHARCDAGFILATVDYGEPITAIVARDNIFGTQFHPEKSQETGLKLIGNFLAFKA